MMNTRKHRHRYSSHSNPRDNKYIIWTVGTQISTLQVTSIQREIFNLTKIFWIKRRCFLPKKLKKWQAVRTRASSNLPSRSWQSQLTSAGNHQRRRKQMLVWGREEWGGRLWGLGADVVAFSDLTDAVVGIWRKYVWFWRCVLLPLFHSVLLSDCLCVVVFCCVSVFCCPLAVGRTDDPLCAGSSHLFIMANGDVVPHCHIMPILLKTPAFNTTMTAAETMET